MEITSKNFINQELIPGKYTCDGEGISPSLAFSGAPKEAKSLALIMNDPDSPSGNFVHWIIWNMDPNTEEIKEGSAPKEAAEGKNDFGKIGYGGPCPSKGTHRYVFRLYALDVLLNLASGSEIGDLTSAMNGHILAEAQYTGCYQRIK